METLFITILSLVFFSLCGASLTEQFDRDGYAEISNEKQDLPNFDSLYADFDALITFLQTNPAWAHKLHSVKERFIRSTNHKYYSTDFFGFYDEAERKGRNQISFYYSIHFHAFILARYPEFNLAPDIIRFLENCFEIQKPCSTLFLEAAAALGLKTLYSSDPPILFKVIKYLPSYIATRPHYDGSAFSLFLDSTDEQSLLLSAYKSTLTIQDFFSPLRKNSFLLIPGTLLTEFSIYPTPHIVIQSGKTRYATIAFAMRSDYTPQKTKYTSLPNFKD